MFYIIFTGTPLVFNTNKKGNLVEVIRTPKQAFMSFTLTVKDVKKVRLVFGSGDNKRVVCIFELFTCFAVVAMRHILQISKVTYICFQHIVNILNVQTAPTLKIK